MAAARCRSSASLTNEHGSRVAGRSARVGVGEAIEKAGVDVVPRIVIGGSPGASTASGGTAGGFGGGTSTSLLEGLLTMLLSDRLASGLAADRDRPRSPAAEAARARIETAITSNGAKPAAVR